MVIRLVIALLIGIFASSPSLAIMRGSGAAGPANLIPLAARTDVRDSFWAHATSLTFTDADTVELTTTAGTFYSDPITVTESTAYNFSEDNPTCGATAPKYSIYDLTHGTWIVNASSLPCTGTLSRNFTTPAGCDSIRIYPVKTATSTGAVDLTNFSLVVQ